MTTYFLFRHYWWIALAALAGGVGLILTFATFNNALSLIAPLLAAVLGFCYFVQQQKLAHTSLFKQLFTEFNRRYDCLNERLLEILSSERESPLTQKQVVIDYLNLCSEEYLFYREGYIHPDVWRSWCRGMLCYVDHEPFKTIWAEEQATRSYYGLSLDAMHEGAA